MKTIIFLYVFTVDGHETNGQPKIYEKGNENIDENISNIGGYSAQKELSHLIADIRYAPNAQL